MFVQGKKKALQAIHMLVKSNCHSKDPKGGGIAMCPFYSAYPTHYLAISETLPFYKYTFKVLQ
jgi:hypothetical protein